MAITGTFATTEQVREAVDALIAEGFSPGDVSAVTASGRPVEELTATPVERVGELVEGAGLGALIGGAVGIASAVLLPGIGPLLVAGPLVLSGALGGSLIGMLVKAGYGREDAEYLEERVRSGRYLVVVHGGDTLRAETVLRNAGAEEVRASPGGVGGS
jgi:outer membrane lipoprotein SlyB